jgi:hypothetical protein
MVDVAPRVSVGVMGASPERLSTVAWSGRLRDRMTLPSWPLMLLTGTPAS